MATAPSYYEAQYQQSRGTSVLAVLGLVLSIIPCTFLLGLLFSVIGIAVTGPEGKKGRGVAIAGLVIALIWSLGVGTVWYGFNQFNQQIAGVVNKMLTGDVHAFWQQLPPEAKQNVTEEQFAERLKELVKPYGAFKQVNWFSWKTNVIAAGNERETVVSVDLIFDNRTVPFGLHTKEGAKQTTRVTLDGKDLDEALGIPVHSLFAPSAQPQGGTTSFPSTQEADED